MIVDYNKTDNEELLALLESNLYQNVYLVIDAETYGFEGEYVSTWILKDARDNVQCIIYRYYNTIQLFTTVYISDIAIYELSEFLKSHSFEMISGDSKTISKLHILLKDDYKDDYGYIYVCEKSDDMVKSEFINVATVDELYAAAKLICTDTNIGGHYDVNILALQLKERMLYKGCRNIIYRKDDKIIGHIATYAETKDMAVLGGLITDSSYRGSGVGKSIFKYVTFLLHKDHKQPILYCYNSSLHKWYESMGWEKVTSCGKLERVNK